MIRLCETTDAVCTMLCGAGGCRRKTPSSPDTVESFLTDLQGLYSPFLPQEALIRSRELLGQVRIQRRLIEREPAYVVSGDEEAHDG